MRTLLTVLLLSSTSLAMEITNGTYHTFIYPSIVFTNERGITLEVTGFGVPLYDETTQTGFSGSAVGGFGSTMAISDGEQTVYTYYYGDVQHGLFPRFDNEAFLPLSTYTQYYMTTQLGHRLIAADPNAVYGRALMIGGVDVTWQRPEFGDDLSWTVGHYTNPRIVGDLSQLKGTDLNGDGSVDALDASLLFGNWTGDSVPSVPEPSSLSLIVLALGMWRGTPIGRSCRPLPLQSA